MVIQGLSWPTPSLTSFTRYSPSILPRHLLTPRNGSRFGFISVAVRNRRMKIFASNDDRRRQVVEHVSLLKAKEGLTDEHEQNMLDYLYTSQYQMRGIVAISLGRITNDNVENYTHAVYIRFQRKEDVSNFYENPFYLSVLKEHVMPYCHELINADYESEVEDNMLPIFRKGEEFNYGVEFVHLIGFDESASEETIGDALASLEKLTKQFPSLIVQSTQGSIFNASTKEFTHGMVTRFRSLEAFDLFMGSTEYKDKEFASAGVDGELWRLKFEQITRKALPIYFSIDPVGKEIM